MKIKGFARRIISFGLCGLIYLTTVGFAIDFHYCSSQLKSISFLGKAASCHEAAKPCLFHKKQKEETPEVTQAKFDCCSNEFQFFQCDQDAQLELSTPYELKFQTDKILSVLCPIWQKEALINQKPHPPPEFEHPLLQRDDLPIWDQSFIC